MREDVEPAEHDVQTAIENQQKRNNEGPSTFWTGADLRAIHTSHLGPGLFNLTINPKLLMSTTAVVLQWSSLDHGDHGDYGVLS